MLTHFEVYTIDADGTNLTNLSNNPGSATVGNSDSQPAFSPHPTKIAFQSNRLGNADIWVMNADGTGARPLTSGSYAEESAPEFSPDGQQIAFQSSPWLRPAPRRSPQPRDLPDERRPTARTPTRLTFSDDNPSDGGGETASNLSGFDNNPHWSPEGDRIVFHSGRGVEFGATQWDAFTINSATGEAPIGGQIASSRLTARNFNDERCGWSVADAPQRALGDEGRLRPGHRDERTGRINCGADCAQGYAARTMVTLTAVPAAGGSTFAGFTGGACAADTVPVRSRSTRPRR